MHFFVEGFISHYVLTPSNLELNLRSLLPKVFKGLSSCCEPESTISICAEASASYNLILDLSTPITNRLNKFGSP
jgi:hypothetical protein